MLSLIGAVGIFFIVFVILGIEFLPGILAILWYLIKNLILPLAVIVGVIGLIIYILIRIFE